MAQTAVNATDDPIEYDLVYEDDSMRTNNINQSTDPLAKLLKENNLYDEFYNILITNGFDLDMLVNDVKHDEIEAYSKDLGFDSIKKVKFRKLMRIVASQKDGQNEAKTNDDNESKSNQDFHSQIEQLQKELDLVKKKTQLNELKGKQDYSMDIAIIGDMAVGKTSLIRRYVNDQYLTDSKSSIGIGHYQFYEELPDKSIMKITIWDTAGQERYADVCSGCYKRADAILICYDSNESVSLDNCNKWREKIEEYARKDDVFVILVACKTDLENMDNINKAEMFLQQKKWAKFNAVHCHCSAKSGDNVRNVFLTAAEKIAKIRKEHGNVDQQSVLDAPEPPEKKRCCVIL